MEKPWRRLDAVFLGIDASGIDAGNWHIGKRNRFPESGQDRRIATLSFDGILQTSWTGQALLHACVHIEGLRIVIVATPPYLDRLHSQGDRCFGMLETNRFASKGRYAAKVCLFDCPQTNQKRQGDCLWSAKHISICSISPRQDIIKFRMPHPPVCVSKLFLPDSDEHVVAMILAAAMRVWKPLPAHDRHIHFDFWHRFHREVTALLAIARVQGLCCCIVRYITNR